MIRVACPSDKQDLQSILIAAFERSCGAGSTHSISYCQLKESAVASLESYSKITILVLVSPPEECAQFLKLILEKMRIKVIIFGVVPPSLAQFLKMRVRSISEEIIASSTCVPAPIHQFSESSGSIRYIRGLGDEEVLPARAMCRFDYMDEWNNLGYGAITADGSIWSLSQCVDVLPGNILGLLISDEKELTAYCALWDFLHASLFWFNREVGPVDSYEWRLIEIYISQYRFAVLPALPVLMEVPYGFDCAITMRLDCDEDVESARPLYQAYKKMGIPFSLALHASILADPVHHGLPCEVIKNGGAILSHTLTHAPNWGGSKSNAYDEGVGSADIIESAVGFRPQYAVSPFHQTPIYAREGLISAGYLGCVGGIMTGDPEFIMARGGRPPYSNSDFIGHSQQCMLHGDCLLDDDDPLKIYKQAFDLASMTKTLFGYLDHPFSSRYQYGWENETNRISCHEMLIEYFKKDKSYIFLNENQALNFIGLKSSIKFTYDGSELKLLSTKINNTNQDIAIEFGGQVYKLDHDGYRVKIT